MTVDDMLLTLISPDIDKIIITNNSLSENLDLNLGSNKSVIYKRSNIPDTIKDYEVQEITITNGMLNLVIDGTKYKTTISFEKYHSAYT